MRTRMHISLVVGDREKLIHSTKNYSKKLESSAEMIFMEALSNPHCYYGEGGKEELFLWGILGEVNPHKFIYGLSEFWKEILGNKAVLENSHILLIWQSTKDPSAYSANIYQMRDNYVPIIIEEIPVDLVIYERG